MQKKESENEISNGIQSHYAQYAKLAKRPYMRYQMKRHQILSKLSCLEDFSSKRSNSVRPPYYLIMGDSQSTSNYLAIQCNRDLVAQNKQTLQLKPFRNGSQKKTTGSKWIWQEYCTEGLEQHHPRVPTISLRIHAAKDAGCC